MATSSMKVEDIFQGYDVLLGGIGPTLEISEFSEDELDLFDKFFKEVSDAMELVSPYVANELRNQKELILRIGEIFKAKVNDKTFGGSPPSPGQIGVAVLAPFDLHYTDSPSATEPAYTAYSNANWKLSITAGNAVYLLGDATNFFKASPTVGRRAMGIIIKNGIVEVGTSPSFLQFYARTEKVDYAPWRAHTLQDQPVDPDRPIYVYSTPFAIPLWYDFGVRMAAMPNRDGVADLRLVGVIFYEYDYYSSLVATGGR